MNINELLLNDEFCQCIRKTKQLPLDELKEKKYRIHNCNHLFVLLSNYTSTSDFIIKDDHNKQEKYECVHCGLTNKFKQLEKSFFAYYPFGYEFSKQTIESELFDEFMLEVSHNNASIHLISNCSLPTYHPSLLYSLALMINENGTNEELFEIMNELHNLETKDEKLRLSNFFQAKALLKRYLLSLMTNIKNAKYYDEAKKYELKKK